MLVLCMIIEESLGDNNVKNIQNHRNGEHIKGYQWGGGEGRMGEKVQGCLLYTSDAADDPRVV